MAKDFTVDEGGIKSVRCSVTNEPMQNVPTWYADVKVRFVSDKGRKSSEPYPELLPIDEVVVPDDDRDISLEELQGQEDALADENDEIHAGMDSDNNESVISLLDDDTDED